VSGGYDNLIVDIQQDVLWLRINRPGSRNALSKSTLGELGRACAGIAGDQSLRAAVITGEGEDAFAAGGDLKELGELRAADAVSQFYDFASGALDQVRRCPVPVVAALNGWALGGGAELAMACDFRVAARNASIGYIQARLNISCGFGGGADLMRRLGPSGALLRGLSADTFGAEQALARGFVDEVAADGESLHDCVMRFLQPMLKQKPQVIRAYKAMAIAERLGLDPVQRRALEREWFVRTWMHDDHWAAIDKMAMKKRETNS
jgi:enoyl-CoA hydratase